MCAELPRYGNELRGANRFHMALHNHDELMQHAKNVVADGMLHR